MSADEGSSSANSSNENTSPPAGVADDNTNTGQRNAASSEVATQPQPSLTPHGSDDMNHLITVINENRTEMKDRNKQIQELVARVEQLQKDLRQKDELIEDLSKQANIKRKMNGPTLPDGLQFPTEIFDEIFQYCNAKTRLNFAATNSYFHKRYNVWRDVKALYITRSAVDNLERLTLIPHTYTVRTNIIYLGTFKATNVVSIAKFMPLTRSMMIESNQHTISSQCNRIPTQQGFFALLQDLEVVKICNITDNLSIKYTLAELFALPKLRILHIREFRQDFLLPETEAIAAPLMQLRLGIAYQNPEKLVLVLDKLNSTLTSLDISPLRSFMPISSNIESQLLPAIAGITERSLTELHIPSIISRHHSFEPSLSILQKFGKLERITFDTMHLSMIVNIVEHLPKSCTHLTVIDTFYINSEMVTLNANQMSSIDKVFSEPRLTVVRNELSRITRPFTIQLGRLRGTNPLTVIQNVTPVVKMVTNATLSPKCKMTEFDKRVFLWNGCVLSRNEFLDRIGVAPFETASR